MVAGASTSKLVATAVRNAAWVSGTMSWSGEAVVVVGRADEAMAPSAMTAPEPDGDAAADHRMRPQDCRT